MAKLLVFDQKRCGRPSILGERLSVALPTPPPALWPASTSRLSDARWDLLQEIGESLVFEHLFE